MDVDLLIVCDRSEALLWVLATGMVEEASSNCFSNGVESSLSTGSTTFDWQSQPIHDLNELLFGV